MRILLLFVGALLLLPGLLHAAAPPVMPLEVDVVDARSGRTLPTWWHDGRLYLAGEPGLRYALRVRNVTGRRLLAVVSVDGVNVLSGETAGVGQRGYVFEPGSAGTIDGWRKSLTETAAFYFTELPDSYAARMGRDRHVGVIGIAVFEEYVPPVAIAPAERSEAAAPAGRSFERQASGMAQDEARAAAPRLGTGHGERLHSVVATTSFRRASMTPAALVTIRYDRLSALVARGIVAPPEPIEPVPFPHAFVPDPEA